MDKHTIIKLKKEGYSNREISRMIGIDRKTVKKYWDEFSNQIGMLDKPGADLKIIHEQIASAPAYDSSKRARRKYTKEIDAYIDLILKNEKLKDSALGIHKQKLTNIQIYQMVKAAGFDISLACVSNHIKIKRDIKKECFIRQKYDYGDRLEYDFGEVKLVIDGQRDTYHIAVLSSPASDFRWAYLYKSQKSDVFMDSHVRFFKMLGGVYKEIVYDNMRNAVSKFIGRNEKELNPNLLILSNYYGFRINVTNCFSGNEKGHVEGSVKIIRNAVFAEKYIFDSYEQAEQYLEKRLVELNENSGIKAEAKCLTPAKPAFELSKITQQKVNSYSFIQVENNMYSVPDYLVGKILTVRAYVDVVKIYSGNHFVCEHKKKDGAGEISIDINHYLTSLARKPGALRNSLALKSLPQLKSIFDKHFSSEPKKFIDILNKNKEKSMDDLLDILDTYTKLPNNVVPLDVIPFQESMTNKTRGIISAYNHLRIGGIN